MNCSGTAMSIRISCSGTAMEVSGSEPVERGLIHVHQGRTDVFTRSDGLSGDIILSLFEDREGNVWVATHWRTRPVSRAPRHYYFCETRFVQRCYSLRARSHGWEHLGWRSRWFDEVEEWTNYHLPESEWTAG